MGEKNKEVEKMEDVLLPGFRFHPTDEELVSFYLKRKVEHRPLSIKLITQLDIYKYDPWDLPKFAMGEKEWYFYCPRDRKYRNSSRPNRVTGAGFWKATGTDRPIYSSEGSKCIGLRKSLVFYKGRAAKGIKTDWMMHEFRLPSSSSSSSNIIFDTHHVSPNDSWAICRILKKTNTTALRAISQSFVSSLPRETSVNTEEPYGNSSIIKNSTCFEFRNENMNVVQPRIEPHSYFDDKEASKISTSPFSSLDFTSSDSTPGPCLDQEYLRSLLLAPQETQPLHQFPKFINNNNEMMISSFPLNISSSSSDSSSFLGEYTNHIDSNIDLNAILAQELVTLPQEYHHETGFEGNMIGANHTLLFGDLSSTIVGDHHQNQKHRMLLESYYSSFSSINEDSPASFFIT